MKRWAAIFSLAICSLSLMAETVVYTVTSRSEVRADGIEPIGAYADFQQSSNTGQKGQMTENNYTSLALYGYSGYRIRSVKLMMHSNKSSGAGTLEMNLGDSCVWAIEPAYFSDDTWYGDFTTTFVPIQHWFTPALIITGNQVVTINIDALQSSLYIASYTIDYDPVPTSPCTVSFASVNSVIPPLTETRIGSGILLPECPDADSTWFFIGWLEQPVLSLSDQCPACYKANTRYYPDCNTTLTALYTDTRPTSQQYILQDTTLQSGDYIIVDKLYKAIAIGGPNKDNHLYAQCLDTLYRNEDSLYYLPLSDIPSAAVYHIDFLPDSMATIYNVQEQSYVSYPLSSTTTFTKTANRQWNYKKAEENMLIFYHNYTSTQYRELRATTGNTLETIDSVYFANVIQHSSVYANILFAAPQADTDSVTPHYTSYPFGTAITQVTHTDGIILTEQLIYNPLQLPIQLFSLQGTPIIQTTHNQLPLHNLPAGIYILKTPCRTYKLMIN